MSEVPDKMPEHLALSDRGSIVNGLIRELEATMERWATEQGLTYAEGLGAMECLRIRVAAKFMEDDEEDADA